MIKHVYGYKPDVKDHRDYLYRPKLRLFLPRKVDLRPLCSLVEDQGALGSCTAQALAGNVEFLDAKDGNGYVDVSRLFIYYNERKMEGNIDYDSGASIRTGIKTLAKEGVCDEILYPYNISRFKERPGDAAYYNAMKKRISLYERLNGINDIMACLADGFPVVFGISIYESFESDTVSKTGIVPMPGWFERRLGGHALMIVGYDMDKKWFIVRNSWSRSWGDGGYCYIPMKYVEKQGNDFWVIRK